MNKKQLNQLVERLVRSTQVLVNDLAEDKDSDEITEDMARTLVGMRVRTFSKQLVADAVGCELEDVTLYDMPTKETKEKSITARQTDAELFASQKS